MRLWLASLLLLLSGESFAQRAVRPGRIAVQAPVRGQAVAAPRPLTQKSLALPPHLIPVRVELRLAELAHLGKAPDGEGWRAEAAVIQAERASLVNVNEVLEKGGKAYGEIDAETDTHLIEVAYGSLNSHGGKKVKQLIRFLRSEAVRRGKGIRYYVDFDLADPETMQRLKDVAGHKGVEVEFKPIPRAQGVN
jgi:hypothetical protein